MLLHPRNRRLAIALALVAFLLIAGGVLLLERNQVRTTLEMKRQFEILLEDYASTPLDISLPPPFIDIKPTRQPEGQWLLSFAVNNFRFTQEPEGTMPAARGAMVLFVDGKPVASLQQTQYVLDNLANGHHVIAVALQDPQQSLYFHKSNQPVSFIIEGEFDETGFRSEASTR